jgi:hypothetical protein
MLGLMPGGASLTGPTGEVVLSLALREEGPPVSFVFTQR